MLYNIVLVSSIHQHEAAIDIHMSPPVLFKFFKKFIYFWLHWVLVAAQGLSPVVEGLLIAVAFLVWSMGSRSQAQCLRHTGIVAPLHVGSCQTRD